MSVQSLLQTLAAQHDKKDTHNASDGSRQPELPKNRPAKQVK